MTTSPLVIRWLKPRLLLEARDAEDALVRTHATRLSAWYNDEQNARLMGNTERLDAADVVAQYEAMRTGGGRPFLLFANSTLVGDADLRNVEKDRAEFAILVGERAKQGQGLGTSFSVMLHAYAFEHLKLARTYLSIAPDNVAARRCYEKVGYAVDTSADARRYADGEADIAMSLTRETFERSHGHAIGRVEVGAED